MRFFRRLVAAVFAASLILPAALAAPVSAAVADHLAIVALPANVTAGAVTLVTVNALDSGSSIDTGYTGTVTLTTNSVSDVVTPASHTYVGGDAGTFQFSVTFHAHGARTLTASDTLITNGTANTTVDPGAADHLSWTHGPDAEIVTGGTPFTTQPVVEVRDSSQNVVTTSSAPVAIAIASWANPTSTTLGGSTTVAAVSGVATFTGISIDKVGVGYRMVATSAGLAFDTTSPFDVTAGPGDHLAYLQNPTNSQQNIAFSPAVTVQVLDAGGNLTTDTSVVHLAIANNPSAGTLAGTVAHNAVAGVATFSNLSINNIGTGYTLAATDGSLTGATSGAFNISLQVNHAPSGTDNTITIAEDATHTFTTSDFGFTDVSNVPPNTLAAVTITTLPTGATLRDNGTVFGAGVSIPVADITGNKLTFTPAANANGTGYTSFTFQVQDNGGTASGGVDIDPTPNVITFNVTPVNDAPVAVADNVVVKQSTVLTTTAATGVLANDTDIDSPHAALSAVAGGGPTHGTLVFHADGSYTYTPTGSYVGPDSFTYQAFDGFLASNVATVSISVYVNHAPVAVNDSKNIITGSPATVVDVLANDNAANPDPGETLTITTVGHAAHGTVSITAGGASVKYQPKSTFLGTDHFTYRITDGQLTASATVTIHVIKDKVKPTTTAPVQTIAAQKIGTSTVVVHVAWTGADVGSGVARYQLQQSRNGGSFKTISVSSSRSANTTLTVSSSYRFRVRAVDKRGNVGAWTYGPTFKVLRFQETSVTFAGTWAARTSTAYSGGKDRSTSETGASATFTTTGRTFSWVAVRGTSRGTAQVFVDGVLARTLDLHLSSTRFQYVVFSTTLPNAAHSIRIVFTGAAPKLIDVDGFIVLR